MCILSKRRFFGSISVKSAPNNFGPEPEIDDAAVGLEAAVHPAGEAIADIDPAGNIGFRRRNRRGSRRFRGCRRRLRRWSRSCLRRGCRAGAVCAAGGV